MQNSLFLLVINVQGRWFLRKQIIQHLLKTAETVTHPTPLLPHPYTSSRACGDTQRPQLLFLPHITCSALPHVSDLNARAPTAWAPFLQQRCRHIQILSSLTPGKLDTTFLPGSSLDSLTLVCHYPALQAPWFL